MDVWKDHAWPAMRREAHYSDRIVRCFAERPASLYETLARAIAARPDGDAVVFDDARLSYRALGAQVDALAAAFAARGLAAGDRIALFVSNRPEFIVALYAAQRLGAIAVPISIREQRPGLAYLLAHSGAAALVLDDALRDRLPSAAETPALRRVVVLAPMPGQGDARQAADPDGRCIEDWRDLLAEGRGLPLAPAHRPHEEDTAAILYTSGTTGRPKGAMLTQLGIVHSIRHFEVGLGATPGLRSVLAVPASHVTGLIANIAMTVAVAGTTVIMAAFKADAFLRLAARERIEHTILVPAMYNLCLLQPDFDEHDLSAWRIGGYGGAPMPVATIAQLARRLPALQLVNAYGSTETTSPVTLLPPAFASSHADSVGVALPCADVVVVDDDGREVAPGVSGELWIGGAMVVKGYWDDPAATAREFSGGFWHSGDIGSVDADGFVRVFDRKKDMLNRGGFKIYSVEVENLLAGVPGVVEAAIVGKPCPVLGERVHAFVHAPAAGLTEAVLRAHCAQHLADYKVPESVTFSVEPLPRNANGKLLKRVLRERLQDQSTIA